MAPGALIDLHCDMERTCQGSVEYIDSKGYVYCAKHGPQRRGGGIRCRKLMPDELRALQAGKTISYRRSVVLRLTPARRGILVALHDAGGSLPASDLRMHPTHVEWLSRRGLVLVEGIYEPIKDRRVRLTHEGEAVASVTNAS